MPDLITLLSEGGVGLQFSKRGILQGGVLLLVTVLLEWLGEGLLLGILGFIVLVGTSVEVGFDKVKVGVVTDKFCVEILGTIGFVKVNEGGGVLCNLVLLE